MSLSPSWSETPKFRNLPIEIRVNDRFDRPFRQPDNTSYLGVRLAQDEKQSNRQVSQYETLTCAGIEYPRQTQEWVKFPVQGGVAKVQFVVFQEDKAPVDYELSLIQDNTVYPLSPAIWPVGVETTQGEVKSESLRAPHSTPENLAIAGFVVVAFGSSYWLLGRLLFARLLRRNLEVSSALGWSNILLLLAWLMALAGAACLIFFPFPLWQKLYWIYLVIPAGYAALLAIVYGAGHLVTRN